MSELKAYRVFIRGWDGAQIIKAVTPSKARYRVYVSVDGVIPASLIDYVVRRVPEYDQADIPERGVSEEEVRRDVR